MSFSEHMIQQVWNKGTAVRSIDASTWRKDNCGAWMRRTDHGDRRSQYGWEIDHIVPLSRGGTNHISNLRPLQWTNNAHKQSGSLGCAVTANGKRNTPIR